jgi:hypothetical protein
VDHESGPTDRRRNWPLHDMAGARRDDKDGGAPMDKNLRIWVDGELQVDEAVRVDEVDVHSLGGPWREAVSLADKKGQPWRVEFGDLDADVTDAHWR